MEWCQQGRTVVAVYQDSEPAFVELVDIEAPTSH
jgi:hypothetical protein